jgi:hypothetical protein
MIIENMDWKCTSLRTVLERILFRIWYPIIIETNWREIKKILVKLIIGFSGIEKQFCFVFS